MKVHLVGSFLPTRNPTGGLYRCCEGNSTHTITFLTLSQFKSLLYRLRQFGSLAITEHAKVEAQTYVLSQRSQKSLTSQWGSLPF